MKVAFGKTHSKKSVPAPQPVERIVERIVEKPVPAPAPVRAEAKKADEKKEYRCDIFFPIGNSVIAKSQSDKILDIVQFLKENPDAKVTLTGYADKGTGTDAINNKIAAQRAKTVYETLVAKGIAKSRMTTDSKGSTVQPFEDNDMNRVTICIAK